MQRKFTPQIEKWDGNAKQYEFPPNCLACTIKNDGNSLFLIDDYVKLEPGQAYPIGPIAGFYLTGKINIKVFKTQAPYSEYSELTFRNAVEKN